MDFSLALIALHVLLLYHVVKSTVLVNLHLIPQDYGFKMFLSTKEQELFRVIHQTENEIIIGARDHMFNISRTNLKLNMNLHWPVMNHSVQQMKSKKNYKSQIYYCKQIIGRNNINKNENESLIYLCDNTIRILMIHDDKISVCGHNRMLPKCRHYEIENNEYKYINGTEKDAKDIFPYTAQDSSVYLYQDKTLWVGTSVMSEEFQAKTQVMKKSIGTSSLSSLSSDYNSNNIQLLDYADFVDVRNINKTIIYFLHQPFLHCDKTPFSNCRSLNIMQSFLMTICKNDQGDSKQRFTSMLKLPIRCTYVQLTERRISKSKLFEFTDIVAVSKFHLGNYYANKTKFSRTIFYAVFKLSVDDLSSSAICVFYEDAIQTAMADKYLYGRDSHNAFHKQEPHRNFNPNTCPPKLKENTNEDQIHYNLIDNELTPITDLPFITLMHAGYTMTCIYVEWQVNVKLNGEYLYADIIYIGTTDGQVLQAVNTGSLSNTVITQKYQFFKDQPVLSISLTDQGLYSVSSSAVMTFNPRYCDPTLTCSECVGLQNPYCSFENDLCASSIHGVQNITSGVSLACSEPLTSLTFRGIEIIKNELYGRRNETKSVDDNDDWVTVLSSTQLTNKPDIFSKDNQLNTQFIKTGETSQEACPRSTVLIIFTAIFCLVIGFLFGYILRHHYLIPFPRVLLLPPSLCSRKERRRSTSSSLKKRSVVNSNTSTVYSEVAPAAEDNDESPPPVYTNVRSAC